MNFTKQLTGAELAYAVQSLAQQNMLMDTNNMNSIINQIIGLTGGGGGGGFWLDNGNGGIYPDNNAKVRVGSSSGVNGGTLDITGTLNSSYEDLANNQYINFLTNDIAVRDYGIFKGALTEVTSADFYAQNAVFNSDNTGTNFYPIQRSAVYGNQFGADYNKAITLDTFGALTLFASLSGIFGSYTSQGNFQNGSASIVANNNVTSDQGSVLVNYNGVRLETLRTLLNESTQVDVTPGMIGFVYSDNLINSGHYFALKDNGDGNPGVALSLPSYADNADAAGAGLNAGCLYKTSTGEVRIVV